MRIIFITTIFIITASLSSWANKCDNYIGSYSIERLKQDLIDHDFANEWVEKNISSIKRNNVHIFKMSKEKELAEYLMSIGFEAVQIDNFQQSISLFNGIFLTPDLQIELAKDFNIEVDEKNLKNIILVNNYYKADVPYTTLHEITHSRFENFIENYIKIENPFLYQQKTTLSFLHEYVALRLPEKYHNDGGGLTPLLKLLQYQIKTYERKMYGDGSAENFLKILFFACDKKIENLETVQIFKVIRQATRITPEKLIINSEDLTAWEKFNNTIRETDFQPKLDNY